MLQRVTRVRKSVGTHGKLGLEIGLLGAELERLLLVLLELALLAVQAGEQLGLLGQEFRVEFLELDAHLLLALEGFLVLAGLLLGSLQFDLGCHYRAFQNFFPSISFVFISMNDDYLFRNLNTISRQS